MARGKTRDGAFRMTLAGAFASQTMRLARSPLVAVHLACALAAGIACGAYFACAPWDPAMGADAFVQFLGSMMPLAAGIACGLAVDEERRAGNLANLVGAPSRGRAVAALYATLLLMGALTVGLAVSLFGAIVAFAGKLTVGAGALAWSVAGITLGSAPLYALMLALSLRFGRNVAIGCGAVGLLVAFFSVGGLAHGLMTGELTAAYPDVLGLVPLSWPARLGSIAVESAIAAMRASQVAMAQTQVTAHLIGGICLVAQVAATALLIVWFKRFEAGEKHE